MDVIIEIYKGDRLTEAIQIPQQIIKETAKLLDAFNDAIVIGEADEISMKIKYKTREEE